VAVVSEVSKGPGWWVASDGKWYPPESHPAAREAPPVQAQWHSMGDPSRHPPTASAVDTLVAPQGVRDPGMGSQEEAFFAGKPRSGSTNGARPAHGKSKSRRPLVLLLVLVLLLAGGAGYYFLIRKSSTPSAGTSSSTTSGSHATRGTSYLDGQQRVGRPVSVPVDGTSLKMTVSKLLDPAPDRSKVAARNVAVAAYATVTNTGHKAYALSNLGISVLQGDTSAGSNVGFGGFKATTAGAALRLTGSLAPGASESGWMTGLGTRSAGPVTSWDVVFNARAAAGVFPISTSWDVK
jgi:hypothetical protein